MEFVLSLIAFYGYAFGLYAFGRSSHPLKDRGFVHVFAIAGFWFLAAWFFLALRARTGYVTQGNVAAAFATIGSLVGVVIGLLIALPYWFAVLHTAVDASMKSALGIDRMKVEQTYDLADAAEKRRQYDEAIRLYLAAAADVPNEAEPFRRAGDAAMKTDRADEAVDYFRRALARTVPPEDVASLAFRIAEILDRRLGRREEACEELRKALGRLGGTKFEDCARERLRRLEG